MISGVAHFRADARVHHATSSTAHGPRVSSLLSKGTALCREACALEFPSIHHRIDGVALSSAAVGTVFSAFSMTSAAMGAAVLAGAGAQRFVEVLGHVFYV